VIQALEVAGGADDRTGQRSAVDRGALTLSTSAELSARPRVLILTSLSSGFQEVATWLAN